MGQTGFFDLERRLDALSAKGDPLETIKTTVPWVTFRADIEAVTETKPTVSRRAKWSRRGMRAIKIRARPSPQLDSEIAATPEAMERDIVRGSLMSC